mmetsp:Transcript_58544/g.161995  ORF Transcript_58544/g.161995 Transcript_58544/m.161995 type:complete len:177 (-) Transcript_58544:15-545(-)
MLVPFAHAMHSAVSARQHARASPTSAAFIAATPPGHPIIFGDRLQYSSTETLCAHARHLALNALQQEPLPSTPPGACVVEGPLHPIVRGDLRQYSSAETPFLHAKQLADKALQQRSTTCGISCGEAPPFAGRTCEMFCATSLHPAVDGESLQKSSVLMPCWHARHDAIMASQQTLP